MQYSKIKNCLNCNGKFYISQRYMYIVFILQCRECKNFLNHTQKAKTLDILVEFHIQIPPSVSTIKHSGRTESFVGLHTDKCPTNVRPNPPRSE
jgi:hypothetical protein